MSLLAVRNLSVQYRGAALPAVDGLDLDVERGEALGLVGESGSGKTQTALAIMGLLPAQAKVSGSIRFEGRELLGQPDAVLNSVRAGGMAMIFQDPGAALNPYVRLGPQLARILVDHRLCPRRAARDRALDMLRRVGLPDPERQYRAYAHQLSGGMRQRVMIGAALIAGPKLIIADEPTTALDVTVQAQILRLIRDLRAASDTALLLITHDFGVIAGNCGRIQVLENGKSIEAGATDAVFRAPVAGGTRRLLSAVPRVDTPPRVGPAPADGLDVLAVAGIEASFREHRGDQRLAAVKPLCFTLRQGETLAVVGESGSGKTTLARAVLGLVGPDRGTVSYLGRPLAPLVAARTRDELRQLQMVFQDPQASLNPALSVRDIVAEPLRVHEPTLDRAAVAARVAGMLERTGLAAELADRYPHELSGGQAQRVAIARALILQPAVIVCDEAVAALDGSVRGEILALLQAEQERSGLALVFITHDLAVVRQVSHRVLVMYLGRLCELSDNEALFRRPAHPYTQALIRAVPVPDPAATPLDEPLAGEAASVLTPPPGCAFHPRCRYAADVCRVSVPEAREDGGRVVACHRAETLDLSL